MKKRLLATLMCLVMVLALLPAMTFAGTPTELWIAGVELTRANPYYHNGAGGAPGTANNVEAGFNAYYDEVNGTLTLNGLNVVNSTALSVRPSGTAEYAITAERDLTIIINGENSISVAPYTTDLEYSESYPLAILGNVVMLAGDSGSGSLTVECNGANTEVGGGDALASCYAVLIGGILEVSSNVTLTATVNGAATGNNAESVGVFASGIAVTGGNLHATAGTATAGSGAGARADSYGILHYGDGLSLVSGSISATGGVASGTTSSSYGVVSQSGEITLSGGSFIAKSGNAVTKNATLIAPIIGDGLTARASTSNDGSSPVTYNGEDYLTYNWIHIFAPPTVREVWVNPATVTIAKGGTQTFNATVIGNNNPSQAVTWSVRGNTSADTTIDEYGVLSVGADEEAQSLSVTATSTADTSKSNTVTATVVERFEITHGAGGEWTKGATGGLGFTSNGVYDTFLSVMVDGETISEEAYDSQSGSAIITLKGEYLDTLSVGRHQLRINYEDGGFAETYFTISAGIPETGDNTHLVMWLCLAALAIAGIILVSRKKKSNEQ